ncbi:sigma-54-dependent transcriptional regulator [Cellvibrio sp.]
MKKTILVVDDDEGILSALTMLLRSEGFAPIAISSPEQALAVLSHEDIRCILMDLNYSADTTSGDEGLKLISAIRAMDELVPIVVMTGWGTIEVAVSAIKKGANDFIQKPWENDRLLAIINNQSKLADAEKQTQKLLQQNQLLREEANLNGAIVARSALTVNMLNTIQHVAGSDASVIFTGENGTGKSLFARYLHQLSGRSDAALISVNMGAVTESLFESEMFGHVKGSFTDAKATRIGRFELADEGTLFLDEIANTPYSQQGKLLRVLEEKQFEKVGSSKTQHTNFRLITATNCDLNAAVSEGKFRKDLLYRINTVEIEIPPLRKRVEDIIPLATAFLAKAATKYARAPLAIAPEAEAALKAYPWPGNVRELGHVMERSQILCKGERIHLRDLGLTNAAQTLASTPIQNQSATQDLRVMEEIEQDIIVQRLAYFNGDAVKAADSLGFSRSAFYRRLEKLKT